MVLIDGGAGQLSAARDVLTDLGVQDVPLVAIAKGPDRDAGREWFYTDGIGAVPAPAARSGALFPPAAARRSAPIRHHDPSRRPVEGDPGRSELDEIAGIGAARKRALLNHFGSARGVKMAGLADLEAAPGISRETARGSTRISIPACGSDQRDLDWLIGMICMAQRVSLL